MPRIPRVPGRGAESTSTGILSPSATNAAFQSIAQDVNRFAVIQGKIAEEDQRQRDSINMSKSLLEAEEGLSELYAAAMESEDYESASKTFDEGSLALGSVLAQGIGNEEDQAKFLLAYTRDSASKDIQIQNRARRLRSAEHRDTLVNFADQTARAAAQLPADDDMGRRTLFETFGNRLVDAQKQGDITDADKQMEDMLELADRYTASRMSRQNPELLESFLAAVDGDGKKVHFLHLDPLQREQAERDAQTGIAAQKRLADADKADRRTAAADESVERTFGVDPHGRPPQTEQEIAADDRLDPDDKVKLIRLANDVASGEWDNKTDYAVYNPLIKRASAGEDVLDEAREHIGVNIRGDDFTKIKSAFSEAQVDPVKKANNRAFEKFITKFEAEVARNDAAKGADRQGLENAADFRTRAKERWDDGLERGVPTADMTDPRHNEFIFNIFPYQRGLEVQLRDVLDNMQIEGLSGDDVPNADSDLYRRPSESPEEWRARTEGQL